MANLNHLKNLTEELSLIENELIIKSYLVDSAVNPIGIADCNGNIIYGNKRWFDLWGYKSLSEVRGLTVYDFYKNKEEVDSLVSVLLGKGKYRGRITGITKNGEEIECILICSVIKNSLGEIIGTTAMFLYEDDVKRLRSEDNDGFN